MHRVIFDQVAKRLEDITGVHQIQDSQKKLFAAILKKFQLEMLWVCQLESLGQVVTTMIAHKRKVVPLHGRTLEKLDQLNLSSMEDFEMNFDREINSYGKVICSVALFCAMNWVDDISRFIKAEGAESDRIVSELFREFWKFIFEIIASQGNSLTEEDYLSKIKKIIMEAESPDRPERASKPKNVHTKLYTGYLNSLRELKTEPEKPIFKLVIHGVLLEIQGKNFQQVYRSEFSQRRDLLQEEFASVIEKMSHITNDNLKKILCAFKDELDRVTQVNGL